MLVRTIISATSAPTLRLLGLVGLAGWLLAFVVWIVQLPPLTDDGQQAIGGDLISFYTAGKLLLGGHGGSLYDLKLQYETQHALIGNPAAKSLCSYVNPPLLAIAMAPLALLPLKLAFVAYSLLAFIAFYWGMRLLRGELPLVRDHWVAALGLGFLFPPLCISITGGQNTAISIGLMCGIYACLRRRRMLTAGLLLGLLSYKPQLGLLIGLLLTLRGEWKTVGAAALTVAAHFIAGATFCGWDWPLQMSRALETYWQLEHQFNGAKSISLLGACQFLLPEHLWRPVGGGIAAILALSLVHPWCKIRLDSAGFAVLFAATISLTLIVSPHTVWYDAGLLLPAGLLLIDQQSQRRTPISPAARLALIVAFFLPAAFALGPSLGFQPVALLPFGVLAWAMTLERLPFADINPFRQPAPPGSDSAPPARAAAEA